MNRRRPHECFYIGLNTHLRKNCRVSIKLQTLAWSERTPRSRWEPKRLSANGTIELDVEDETLEVWNMADSYLQLAEEILRGRGKPLSAKQILSEARRFGIMPEHLSGETMHKTLQARISDDINILKKSSRFYRVGIGQYFLRELATDPTLPYVMRREIVPSGRVRAINTGRLLHCRRLGVSGNSTWVDPERAIAWVRDWNVFNASSKTPDDQLRVGTFSMVTHGGKYFNFELGKFSPFFDSEDEGLRSLGLRRYIDEFDHDIFSESEIGLDFSSTREVVHHFCANDEREFLDDQILRQNLRMVGAVVDDERQSLFLVCHVQVAELSSKELVLRNRKDVRHPRMSYLSEIEMSSLDKVSRMVLFQKKYDELHSRS